MVDSDGTINAILGLIIEVRLTGLCPLKCTLE